MDKKLIFIVFSSLWIACSSCSENRVFEEFHSFDKLQWDENDTVVFDLQEVQSIEGKGLIAIRYNETYPFSNCYIRLISRDSGAQILQNKLLNVPIFNSKSGQPMGKGFGSTFTKYDTLPFSMPSGTKELVVVQYMRQAQLEGIESVGFKLLKP